MTGLWSRSLVQAEVDFERDDDRHCLAVRADGGLAAPGPQGRDGVLVEAEAGTLDDAQIAEPAIEIHDRFDAHDAGGLGLARLPGVRWIGHEEPACQANAVHAGMEHATACAATFTG